ncbi:MAG: GlsB/YeaQ/YmgE family stress response membrane protein [Gemmatimonadota bacterium]
MGLLSWIVVGCLVGALFALGSRDRGPETAALTVCAGVIGALAGGLVMALLRWGRLQAVHPDALVLAVVGAALFAASLRAARRLRR